LEQRFGRSNGAKLYRLQKELSCLVQENNDIAGYFTKLKRLWDELDSLNLLTCCICVCTCEGKGKLTKALEDQRLIQFLMGLNDLYAQARGTILMMTPLPTIDSAYALLLQDENHREGIVHPPFSPAAASFMATGQGRGNYKTNNQTNNQTFRGGQTGQRFGYSSTQKSGKPAQKFKPRKTKYNPNVSCTYCGKTGHVHDDCHRLIGYPDDFEFTKSRNFESTVKGNAVIPKEEAEDVIAQYGDTGNNNYAQYLSKEQYSNLVQQVKKDMHINQASSSGSTINANAIAGTILKYSGSCFTVYNSNVWIIDSGASEHMCFNSKSFMSLTPLPIPLNISLPNSFRITVTHTGNVNILPNPTLYNVLHVPDFKCNLLFVHKLSNHLHCNILFTPSTCVLHDLSLRKEQVFGEVGDGLYLLKPSRKQSQSSSNIVSFQKGRNSIVVSSEVVSIPKGNHSSTVSVSVAKSDCMHFSTPIFANVVPNVALWHVRLGHLPFSVMKNLSFLSINSNSQYICPVCPKARHHRLPSKVLM